MADEPKSVAKTIRVKMKTKYWPMNMTSGDDALDIGTVVELPAAEAKRCVDLGIAEAVLKDD